MAIRESEAEKRRFGGVTAMLACALVIVTLALIVALNHLSAMKAQVKAMETWRSEILQQLGAAGQRGDVDPADASEALAEIISSRDGAQLLLSQRGAGPASEAAPAPVEGATAPADIATLTQRASTGVAGEDAAAIDRDSQTPWKDWK
jgi:hypothetical protein